MSDLAPLLDPDDLAVLLKLSPSTIRRLASQDETRLPPRVQNMRVLRWHPAEVEAWLRPPPKRVGRPRG